MSMLKVENLGITFGGLKAVENLSLEIEKNELYGLIGPNGAGKTTVFNMLTGVYKPTTGKFYLDGEDLTGKSSIEINRKGIARTFQNIRLFGKMTVSDNVMVGLYNQMHYSLADSLFRTRKYFDDEKLFSKRADELLAVFGLYDDRETLASNLPYGKQRKLEIARALATDPKLLLLDEPAAGMNPYETEELMETIKLVRDRFDMTILLIEHDMKLVGGICDELTVLCFGQELMTGPTRDVLNDPQVIKAYLGDE